MQNLKLTMQLATLHKKFVFGGKFSSVKELGDIRVLGLGDTEELKKELKENSDDFFRIVKKHVKKSNIIEGITSQ